VSEPASELVRRTFEALHADLPQQGPGDDASTLRALAACRDLPPQPRILDVGCGPGRQTITLARAAGADILAVDLHPPFLAELERRAAAAAAGVEARIETRVSDMRALDLSPGSFDLVWSEGAAYIMGLGDAARAWRPLLRPGGSLVVSELVWSRPEEPPADLAAFWAEEYPALGHLADAESALAAAGFDVVETFPIPDSAWWSDYYAPLQVRIGELRATIGREPEAAAVLDAMAREIDMRRRFPEWYEYRFFMAGRSDGRD